MKYIQVGNYLLKINPRLYIYLYIYIYIYIYMLPPWRLNTAVKEWTIATRVMPSSFNELSTLVSERGKYKQKLKHILVHWELIKLGGFRSQFEASRKAIHTEQLWYDEIVCLCMTDYIYIYIYIYIYHTLKIIEVSLSCYRFIATRCI